MCLFSVPIKENLNTTCLFHRIVMITKNIHVEHMQAQVKRFLEIEAM